jgi:hypothetical protein
VSVVVGSMVPVAERVCRRVVRTAGNSRYDGLVEAVDRVTAQAPIDPPATTMTIPTTMSGRERSPRRLPESSLISSSLSADPLAHRAQAARRACGTSSRQGAKSAVIPPR